MNRKLSSVLTASVFASETLLSLRKLSIAPCVLEGHKHREYLTE